MKDRGPDKRLLKLLPVVRWPTAEESAESRLFSPIRVGGLEVRDRTWVPAMVPWRASAEGFVTPNVVDWYARFASGRPGVLVVEATGIRDVASGPLLRIGDDRFVPGLRDLVAAVREASGGHTRLFIQLIDFLAIKRRPPREKFLERFLVLDETLRARLATRLADVALGRAPESTVRGKLLELDIDALRAVLAPRDFEAMEMGARERVTDVQLPHVRDLPLTLPPLFAAAARRAKEAGFDGVELHYAHAYTMSSFLSALNDRADGYGGPREHRVRLPLEVFRAVRAAVGDGYVVGCRLLGDDVVAGGSRLEDAAYFTTELVRAGMDFVSVSKGGRFEDAEQPKVGAAAYPYTGPSGHECMPSVHIGPPGPFSRNVPLARTIRAAVRAAGLSAPIVAAGGISTFEQAETILVDGDADFVAVARQALSDPDFFEKLRRGRGEQIRRCFYTNYCEALDQSHKEVTCQRWDRDDSDGAFATAPRSADGKRRLVAPAWPLP